MEIRKKVNPLVYSDLCTGDVFVVPNCDIIFMKCFNSKFIGPFAIDLKTGVEQCLSFKTPVRKINAVLDVDY